MLSRQSRLSLFPENEIPSIKRGVHKRLAVAVGLTDGMLVNGLAVTDAGVGLADAGAGARHGIRQGFTGARNTILQMVAVFLPDSCWTKIKIFSGVFKQIFSLDGLVSLIFG